MKQFILLLTILLFALSSDLLASSADEEKTDSAYYLPRDTDGDIGLAGDFPWDDGFDIPKLKDGNLMLGKFHQGTNIEKIWYFKFDTGGSFAQNHSASDLKNKELKVSDYSDSDIVSYKIARDEFYAHINRAAVHLRELLYFNNDIFLNSINDIKPTDNSLDKIMPALVEITDSMYTSVVGDYDEFALFNGRDQFTRQRAVLLVYATVFKNWVDTEAPGFSLSIKDDVEQMTATMLYQYMEDYFRSAYNWSSVKIKILEKFFKLDTIKKLRVEIENGRVRYGDKEAQRRIDFTIDFVKKLGYDKDTIENYAYETYQLIKKSWKD